MAQRIKSTFLDRVDIPVEGSCFIYKRIPQGSWQYYICIPKEATQNGNNEIRRSCKTKDMERAKIIAFDAYMEVQNKLDKNKTVHKVTFKRVAIELLANLVKREETKHKVKDYERPIKNYFIPFFGRKNISSITDAQIREYWSWRNDQRIAQIISHQEDHEKRVTRDKLIFNRKEERKSQNALDKGKTYIQKKFVEKEYKPRFTTEEFPASTIASELAPLRIIFKFAVSHDYMSNEEIPNIESPISETANTKIYVKRNSKPRASFSFEEVRKLKELAIKRFRERRAKYFSTMRNSTSPRIVKIREISGGYFKPDDWMRDKEAKSSYILMLAIYFIAHTGMRPNTMVQLRVGDVFKIHDDENKDIRLALPSKSLSRDFNFKTEKEKFLQSIKSTSHEKSPRYLLRGRTKKGKGGSTREINIVPDWELALPLRVLVPT
jgi:integrase